MTMLWYKAWIDTRLRFLVGLALLSCSVAFVVLAYPRVLQLLPSTPDMGNSELGRQISEALAIAREYRGYVWSQVFQKNVIQMWTLFAVILGSGSVAAYGLGSGTLFTLSLPVSRTALVWARAVIGLAEIFALAIVPALLVSVLSPAIGESYSAGAAIVHALCLAIGGAVFFALAVLLSTAFTDIWRPLLIALAVTAVIGLCESALARVSPYGLFRMMSGESFFRTGRIPWMGLVASAAATALMLAGAARNFARRDF
jgi:ABC-type transport system involved in multi-copper enzyme maturation permease subunit